MVKVFHKLGEKEVHGAAENPSFILTNKKGGYLFLSALDSISRFQGAYFAKPNKHGWELFKTIEDIKLISTKPDTLVNNLYNIERKSADAIERFYAGHDNYIVYEVENFKGAAQLVLDCRKMYDFSDAGRIYKITQDNGCLLVEYTKYEDCSLKKSNYRIFIAIKGIADYKMNNSWEKRYYSYDAYRKSAPSELYVYNALNFNINGNATVILSFSADRKEAVAKASYIEKNFEYIKKSQKNYTETLCRTNLEIAGIKTELAYCCCLNQIDALTQQIGRNFGMYAGLPWFFQFWTRDSAVSLKAMIVEENYTAVKKMLFSLIKNTLRDGRISNMHRFSAIGSADGVGFVYRRFYDFIDVLSKKRMLVKYMTPDELETIKQKLDFSILKIIENYGDGLLIRNSNRETWMDSGSEGNDREGFRIEIQALQLSMYKLAAYISKLTGANNDYSRYRELEKDTAKKVKEVFWDGSNLLDGLGDSRIRPNVFLAYYIYPELLSSSEWEICFDNALKELWCSWGGLTSINRNDDMFCANYTGQDNKSYHNGDSWFWINNFAAACMLRLNKMRFKPYIEKILEASAQEILFRGAIGHHAELSSVSSLKSEGCLSQLWSAAAFVELVNEFYTIHNLYI